MNQENKFGEYWKKLQEYWAVFTAACGKYWNLTKENGKKLLEYCRIHGAELLQKLAAWSVEARAWLKVHSETLRRNGRKLLQRIAAWLLEVHEKLQPKLAELRQKLGPRMLAVQERLITWFRQGKAWCIATAAKLRPAETPALEVPQTEAIEAPAEASQPAALPPVEEEIPAVQEPARRNLPEWMQHPYLIKAAAVCGAIGRGIKLVIKWVWKLRTIFMAIPVVWAAVKVAMLNMERLPEQVGLDIQSTGEFARMITREEAVYWPLGITAFCLLLMFCSKKPMLPWVISIFTLVLPWLIWILNFYA